MKKLLVFLAFCSLALATPSLAVSDYTHTTTTTVSVSGDSSFREDPANRCTPMVGNWVNSATKHCMMQGSGGNAYVHTWTITVTKDRRQPRCGGTP